MLIEWCDASCGVKSISYLGSTTNQTDIRNKTKLSDFFDLLYLTRDSDHNSGAFNDVDEDAPLPKGYVYVFSDNVRNGNAKRIAGWIREYKLGTLVSIGPGVNPNTGRKIVTYMWKYNGKKPTPKQLAEAGYTVKKKPKNHVW